MKIESRIKDYNVEIIDGLLQNKNVFFDGLHYGRLFYFIDENFFQKHKKDLKEFIGSDFSCIIPALETNKSYFKLGDYYKVLIEASFRRNDILVTFGGGILQDISGFISSTLYRGIRWVFFPTTLLAQADSCIGSKTSINFDNYKNLIGTFYPPDRIFINPSFCRTLEPNYFNSGLGEIIKFHLMSDKAGYLRLKKYINSSELHNENYLKEIILSTLEIKKSYFDADEFDTGRRNLLNYGHCFGHALESATDFKVCHGEAVLAGMGFANLLSLKRRIMTQAVYDEFEQILQRFYPCFNISSVNIDEIIKYMKRDKKRTGNELTMILSEGIGKQFKFDNIKEAEIRDTYINFLSIYPKSNRRPVCVL